MKRIKVKLVSLLSLMVMLTFSLPASSETGCIGGSGICVVIWECDNCNGQPGHQEEILVFEGYDEFEF